MPRTLTVAQAKTMLENIAKEKPERWIAAANTILLDLFETTERLRKDLAEVTTMLDKVLPAIARNIKMLRGDAPSSAEPAVGAETPDAPPAGPVAGDDPGDGRAPLTESQAQAEAEMDAALAAESGVKRRPARRAAAANGRAAPVVGAAPPASPEDADAARQAAAERAMDAAVAAEADAKGE